HAAVLIQVLSDIGVLDHFRLMSFGSYECEFAKVYPSNWPCATNVSWEISTINALKPSVVIMSSNATPLLVAGTTQQQFSADQIATFRAIRAPGRLLIDIGNTPV